ncbi:Ribosomal RNA processing protein 36 homolog [Eumeta japonica]|uniref:rRNA biogenesis protein RRP36 n=1 Tax=Eumeta variegata TaxID=151549 RepID=A0A4C1TFA7_EUMVA|nr:Ribosomal RNA processing protein 36 homolog [Eumeta japonica]
MSDIDESYFLNSENECDSESESIEIRKELSALSSDELQKLKEKMGLKLFNEALFGKKTIERNKFKRENKNRPREVSSKKPVSMIRDVGTVSKKTEFRDPRFDPLCGTFDKKEFQENYSFLSDQKKKDLKKVMKEMKETDDPERKLQCRRLIQRLKDQMRSEKRNKTDKELNEKHKQDYEDTLQKGIQPHFATKSERRIETLVKQYEELKSEGIPRIQRHLKRRQQKLKKKSHRLPAVNN